MKHLKKDILYVFGGEKAQGAEIVIERLMENNLGAVNPHLIISPGEFASALQKSGKPYSITTLPALGKLNRSSSSSFVFYLKAIRNYFIIC